MSNFMEEAIKQAKIAFEKNEVPVGAIIVENGQIIAKAYNQNRLLNDPTGHAEILALRMASKIKKSHRLEKCDIYITLEPCAMCLAAISIAKIRRIYYALSDAKFGAVENGIKLFSDKSAYYKPEIYSGFMAEESKELMISFFKTKRKNL